MYLGLTSGPCLRLDTQGSGWYFAGALGGSPQTRSQRLHEAGEQRTHLHSVNLRLRRAIQVAESS
jgi:hypothetical protein